MQTLPAGQTLPQLPQLYRSLLRLAHWPAQFVSPLGQVVTHAPPVQAVPAGQTLPQAPQLLLSLAVATQWPLQSVLPGGQLQVS